MADEDSEKTEEPTPERRRKAREEGQFPRGKDAGNTLASFAVLLTMVALGDDFVEVVETFTKHCYSEPFQLVRGDPAALGRALFSTIGYVIFPLAAAAALGALALGLYEAGFQPNMSLIAPKWSRMDPIAKLKKMLTVHETALDLGIQILRVAAVGVVALLCVQSAFPKLMRLSRVELRGGATEVVMAVLTLALWSSLVLAALALLDYVKSYHSHEKSIRMSRQELKDEIKQQEGDPRIRQRQRARAREALRHGIAQAVQTSDFVIANPTHISVAVRYRVEEGAPLVTAKGYDEVALYIRKLAREADIPVIENRPLARILAKRVKAGKPVPVDLYAAVAEVLAFVYRLKGKKLDSLTRR